MASSLEEGGGPKHVNWQNIIATIEYEINEQVVQNAYAGYGRESDVENGENNVT